MLLLQQQQEQQGHQQQQQQQTSSIASTASRVHFQFDSHPEALLLLNNVGDHDEGIYRCRVDFGRSPTRNVLVQLTVVGIISHLNLNNCNNLKLESCFVLSAIYATPKDLVHSDLDR
jgi:hypothetical protein